MARLTPSARHKKESLLPFSNNEYDSRNIKLISHFSRILVVKLTNKQRGLLVGLASVLVIIAALAVWDAQTDAISCALNIPARLAPGSPATQNGFELVTIVRGSELSFEAAIESRRLPRVQQFVRRYDAWHTVQLETTSASAEAPLFAVGRRIYRPREIIYGKRVPAVHQSIRQHGWQGGESLTDFRRRLASDYREPIRIRMDGLTSPLKALTATRRRGASSTCHARTARSSRQSPSTRRSRLHRGHVFGMTQPMLANGS